MKARRLARFDLTVTDLAAAMLFYRALGFVEVDHGRVGDEMAALLGGDRISQARLARGEQMIALQSFTPGGLRYPADPSANDQSFQHLALPVSDIAAAYARLPAHTAISDDGPQKLPASSGGATAYKFRDPDGHPLELIQFPDRKEGGIDHSAIVATDAERSIAFYRDTLGLDLASRQTNSGSEQDRLDGLARTSVDVVALAPPQRTPHVELLAYHCPPVQPCPTARPCDVVATRLVFEVADLLSPRLMTDPDGHHLLLLPA